MITQESSRKAFLLYFIVLFLAVFVALTLIQFLGLDYLPYNSLAAGAVAALTSAALKGLRRHLSKLFCQSLLTEM
jgi:hypothetical protein